MNSRNQSSYNRRSNEYGRRLWEQNQRMNNSRRSRLQEKRFRYKHSKSNATSQNKNNQQNLVNSSDDIQRKHQPQEAMPPISANETVTSFNYRQSSETILSNSPLKDYINTSTNSSFLESSRFEQNSSNASLNVNKSQDNFNNTSATQVEQNHAECKQDIKQRTISELLNEVCNEPGTDVSNIASKFFQALVTELLTLTDSLPEKRSFIYNILSTLVDLGMRCAHKEVNQENVSESPEVENNSCENSYFKDLHSLINVDYRLQSLLKERVDLYGNIYNIMRRVQKDPNDTSTFDDTVVQNSIGNIKKEIAAITDSFNNLQSTIIPPNELNSNSCIENRSLTSTSQNENQETATEQRNAIQNSSRNELRNENRSQTSVNEALINQSFGTIQSTELQCFCIHDQVLIGGYKNGSILIFCLETGTLLDNVQPHKKPITSITVKDDILITTSLDGIMKKYDLKYHTVKKLNLEHGIYSSFCYKDIIYLGTNSGNIFRVIIKEMKQFSIPLCVSKETVLAIKVTEERNVLLMFIAIKESSVCIRDGTTGSLLYIFSNFQNATNIMLLNEPLRICAGFDDKMLVREVKPAKSYIMKSHSVTCMILHSGIIFIASKDHQIYIYDEKTVSELFILSNVPKNITGMAVWHDSLIIVSSKGFKYLKIPMLVLGRFEN